MAKTKAAARKPAVADRNPDAAPDRIAVRAYHLWEAAGRPHGCHEAHWLQAEVIERRGEPARRTASTRRAKHDAAPEATAPRVATPKSTAAAMVAAATVARGAGAARARPAH